MLQISAPPFATEEVKPLIVLVVDDEEPFRHVIRHCLEEMGHFVMSAQNGREAIGMLSEQNFDVIITDVVMPNGDGLEVTMAVKKQQPGARIIAMSGGGSYLQSDGCLRVAKSLGAHQVLAKPFKPQQLFAAVASATGVQVAA